MRTVVAQWDGEAFVPLRSVIQSCRRDFKIGERYAVDVIEERSAASHKQYFAAVREAWLNLDEEAAARYPSPDHLRAWALIKCGYCKETTFVLDSPEHAAANAAFLRDLDDAAVVVVKGNVVKIYIAKSQRMGRGGMNKDQFEASKQSVLEILSGFIGVSTAALKREGKENR